MMALDSDNTEFVPEWMTLKAGGNHRNDLQQLTQQTQHRAMQCLPPSLLHMLTAREAGSEQTHFPALHPKQKQEVEEGRSSVSVCAERAERSCRCFLELHAEKEGSRSVMLHSRLQGAEGVGALGA